MNKIVIISSLHEVVMKWFCLIMQRFRHLLLLSTCLL